MTPVASKRAVRDVFLDRDGTINRKAREGEYVTRWEHFEFLPGAVEAIRLLGEQRIRVFVVTNQRGVARGKMSEAQVAEIHARMLEHLRKEGGAVERVYHCPHEKASCDCRKPELGMFLQAQREHEGVDFSRAAVIGDSRGDIEAALRLGSLPVLVAGVGAGEQSADVRREPSLLAAVEWLIGQSAE